MKNSRPRRTCLGCGATEEQARLLRIVRKADGELLASRSAEGRGGYLHAARECWNLFLRRKSVYRAFRAEVDKAAKERLIAGFGERS